MPEAVNAAVLRCPFCRAPFVYPAAEGGAVCRDCGRELPVLDGVPLLIRDHEKLEASIAEARASGRREWYEKPQMPSYETGPYRHHLRKRRDYVDAVLHRHLGERAGKPDAVGLDLGCGDGSNLTWLSSLLGTLYASDYNILRLARAAAAAPGVQVFLADATDYPAADDAFDVIFFNHVLEHIPADRAALREARRILKPGGLLVLGVPNEGAFFWRLAYRLQPETRALTDHVHFYTAASLAALCREAGLIVREMHSMGWGVPHWTLDERIRGFKWVDDLFEFFGKRFLPSQATSLYAILSK